MSLCSLLLLLCIFTKLEALKPSFHDGDFELVTVSDFTNSVPSGWYSKSSNVIISSYSGSTYGPVSVPSGGGNNYVILSGLSTSIQQAISNFTVGFQFGFTLLARTITTSTPTGLRVLIDTTIVLDTLTTTTFTSYTTDPYYATKSTHNVTIMQVQFFCTTGCNLAIDAVNIYNITVR